MRVAVMALVAVLTSGCAGSTPVSAPAASVAAASTTPTASGALPRRFHEAGLFFDIPSSWHAESMYEPFHYERLYGYVGDGSWKLTCPPGAQPGEFNPCTVSIDLSPDTAVVRVSEHDGPPAPSGPIDSALSSGASASPLIVGGLPAAVQTVDASGTDEMGLLWTLTVPGDQVRFYTLLATIRGPDFSTVRAELDTMIQSVTIKPVAAPSG